MKREYYVDAEDDWSLFDYDRLSEASTLSGDLPPDFGQGVRYYAFCDYSGRHRFDRPRHSSRLLRSAVV